MKLFFVYVFHSFFCITLFFSLLILPFSFSCKLLSEITRLKSRKQTTWWFYFLTGLFSSCYHIFDSFQTWYIHLLTHPILNHPYLLPCLFFFTYVFFILTLLLNNLIPLNIHLLIIALIIYKATERTNRKHAWQDNTVCLKKQLVIKYLLIVGLTITKGLGIIHFLGGVFSLPFFFLFSLSSLK